VHQVLLYDCLIIVLLYIPMYCTLLLYQGATQCFAMLGVDSSSSGAESFVRGVLEAG
jgi:hypothetical protein